MASPKKVKVELQAKFNSNGQMTEVTKLLLDGSQSWELGPLLLPAICPPWPIGPVRVTVTVEGINEIRLEKVET